MIKLHNQEAWDFLNGYEGGKWDMIFMDPPDNIGLTYGELGREWDMKLKSVYYTWLKVLLMNTIVQTKVLWLSYYHKHDLEIKRIVNWILRYIKPSWEARTFIWRFTFGQYRETDCGSGYRPILRLSAPGVAWNTNTIRVESERMRLGDPRAAGPRVPDDVWEFPRVVGNSPERRAWIPTQHPEGLIERIVKMSIVRGTNIPRVLELFTGSGTMIRVVKRLRGIDLDTVELSKEYVTLLKAEYPEIQLC